MAAQLQIDDQESLTNSDNGEIFNPLSDNADTSELSPRLVVGNFSGDSTILLNEGSVEYDVIKNCFLSGMGSFASETTIVAMRKISMERITTKAKFVAFKVFTEAMARKNGGNANTKFGWYSGTKEEINSIVSYGFSNREIIKFENEPGANGVGIHLFNHRCSHAAAVIGEGDEEGMKHLLLCRLILGKPEQIISGSKQSSPSSTQFDSGVDNLQNPRKYVIWSTSMNSYILPTHIVSFKLPRLRGLRERARSPCVSFSVLMPILSKSLDAPRMNLILTTYDNFREGKVRREQLIRKMREVVGDHLLFKILKNQRFQKYREKETRDEYCPSSVFLTEKMA